MRLDLHVARALLLDVEAAPGPYEVVSLNDDVSRSLFHTIVLLTQAGYLDSNDSHSTTRTLKKQMVLTWRGQELLNAIRSEETWALLKTRLPIEAGTVPFHIVEQVAYAMAAYQGTPMSP